MSDNTKIEYADASWPIVAGCDHVSPGCDNCYAARLTGGRLKHQPAYTGLAEHGRFNGTVRTLPDRLDWPLHWRKPRRIFVSDMADLFHEKVDVGFIADVFAVMALTPRHTYLIFTKRHARKRALLNDPEFWYQVGRQARHLGYHYDAKAANYLADGRNIYDTEVWDQLRYLPNVWLMVSVENQKWADIRIPHLLATPAAVRGISAEPLLGPIDLKPGLWLPPVGGGPRLSVERPWESPGRALDWVITGGESGPGARPAHPDWFRQIRDQCVSTGTAWFFKQWGEWRPQTIYSTDDRHHVVMPDGRDRGTPWPGWGIDQPDAAVMERVGKVRAGRVLDGRTWDEYPGGGDPA